MSLFKSDSEFAQMFWPLSLVFAVGMFLLGRELRLENEKKLTTATQVDTRYVYNSPIQQSIKRNDLVPTREKPLFMYQFYPIDRKSPGYFGLLSAANKYDAKGKVMLYFERLALRKTDWVMDVSDPIKPAEPSDFMFVRKDL